MRVIFQEPIEYDELALTIELLIRNNEGELDDNLIVERLKDSYTLTERDIRYIVERLNYNKYLEIDNPFQYKKIKGTYHIIDVDSQYRDRVRNKIRTDFLADLRRWKITEQKLGDVNVSNMTLSDIEKYLEVE